MSNDKKTPDKLPRPVVLPDGTVFNAYGIKTTSAPPPIKPIGGFGASVRPKPKPAQTPDWDFWLHMPEVKLWQAVALSMNIDPDSLKHHPQACMAGPGAGPIFTEDSYPSREERDRADKRLRLLAANKTVKNGFSPGTLSMDNPANHGVRLSEFAAWAVSKMQWPGMPPELVAMARKPSEQADASAQQKDAPVTPEKVGDGDTVAGGDDWQTKCREIADELHAKDIDAGAWSSVSDIANRAAPIADERKIRGPNGRLTGPNILRMCLQGDMWNKRRNKS